jgi:hypothetical protein
MVVAAACSLLAAGCTSISWEDGDGVVHHMGLVWGRVDDLPRGERVVVTKFGLDLRLNGPDSGYSIGWKSQELVAPAHRTAAPDDLANEVYSELDAPHTSGGDRGDWRFLYFRESVSSRTTLATAYCAGLELRTGPLAPGMTVGWHRGWQLLGDALQEDVVHVHWLAPSRRSTNSATLWTLEESDDKEPLTTNGENDERRDIGRARAHAASAAVRMRH